MGGQHLAVIITLLIWICSYFISLFYFGNTLSNGLLAILKARFSGSRVGYIIMGIPFMAAILAGLLFRLGGILEKDRGIAWGCYIELFTLGTLGLWGLSALSFFIILLICLVNPALFGFQSRRKAIGLYVVHHAYTLLQLILMRYLIEELSGPLSGKDSTCL